MDEQQSDLGKGADETLSGIIKIIQLTPYSIKSFNVDNGTIVRLDYRVTESGLDDKNIIQQILGSISGPSASSLGM